MCLPSPIIYVYLRHLVVELHPEVALGEMPVEVCVLVEGGELLAKTTFRLELVGGLDPRRRRDVAGLSLPTVLLQPVLKKGN